MYRRASFTKNAYLSPTYAPIEIAELKYNIWPGLRIGPVRYLQKVIGCNQYYCISGPVCFFLKFFLQDTLDKLPPAMRAICTLIYDKKFVSTQFNTNVLS